MKTTVGRNKAKIFGLLTGVVCLLSVMYTEAKAAGTVTVTPDRSSVAIGESVNVIVQTSEPEDPATPPQVSVIYNSDMLTFVNSDVECGGGGGLLTFTGQSATITFTAMQTGNVNVGAEAVIDDDGANPATGASVVTVVASAQEGVSSDATLYALEMNPGQMVPAFSPDVTEYKIIIANDVTDITVSGAVSDPSAQITAASGFKNLKEGTNQAVITITAADGTTLTYHFTIERSGTAEDEEAEEEETGAEEAEEQQVSNGLDVTIDNVNYTVQSVIASELLPDGCIKTTANYNGYPVEAALFEKGGLTLLYALAEDGVSGEFFIYNEATGKLQFFVQIYNIENRYIVPVEAQDNPPAQFKAEKMQWNNSYLPAFVLADSSVANADSFYLLYAVSNEGERGFYLYDAMEGTYQRFLNYTGAKSAPVSAGDGTGKGAIIAIVVLSVLLAGAVLLIVNMVIKNKEEQEDALLTGNSRPKKKAARPKPERKTAAPRAERKTEDAKPEKKQERKPAVRKTITPEPDELDELLQVVEAAEAQSAPKQPVAKVATPKPAVSKVTEEKEVTGAVGITGNIPIKVVPTPKAETRRPMVPIYTLERPPVQLTREAPPDQLDDDFEFEFINMENE